MKILIIPEVVEVPDEIGQKLIDEQREHDESDYEFDQHMARYVYLNGWSYDVRVPYRWKKIYEQRN